MEGEAHVGRCSEVGFGEASVEIRPVIWGKRERKGEETAGFCCGVKELKPNESAPKEAKAGGGKRQRSRLESCFPWLQIASRLT
jgi:hypothetical protein